MTDKFISIEGIARRYPGADGGRRTLEGCGLAPFVDLVLGVDLGTSAVKVLALDSSGARSVLIGSGLTDASGKYRAVLPDVPAPAN